MASACTNFGLDYSASFASHLSLEKASRALTTACWVKKKVLNAVGFIKSAYISLQTGVCGIEASGSVM